MNSLREGNRRGVIKVSLGGQGVASAIYLPCCYIAIYTFGTKTASDIMTNVTNAGQTETLILSIIFLLIASMHIPIILFVGKEAMLILFYTLTKTPKEEMVEIQGGDITAGET